MPHAVVNIEEEYQRRVAAMTPAERVARGAAMFALVRQSIGRRIVAERGPMNDEELKWRVAMHLYGDENDVLRLLIQGQIDRFSN